MLVALQDHLVNNKDWSISTMIFDQLFLIGVLNVMVPDNETRVKARSFPDGWKTSDVSQFAIFRKGHSASSEQLEFPSSHKYKGSGPRTIIDFEKADATKLLSPMWLGFQYQNSRPGVSLHVAVSELQT